VEIKRDFPEPDYNYMAAVLPLFATCYLGDPILFRLISEGSSVSSKAGIVEIYRDGAQLKNSFIEVIWTIRGVHARKKGSALVKGNS
jgi:hypothetical protein